MVSETTQAGAGATPAPGAGAVSGRRGPDFFIVGAPKCGTTAMSEYLRGHADVFLSTPKEPLFFCADFTGVPRPRTLSEYLALFRSAPREALAGEASAMYLYSDVAIAELHRAFPHARLIAMLRHPVDLAHAFHAEMLFGQNEDEPDFSTAWALQEERRAGRSLPARCWEPAFLQYRDVARLGHQLSRLLATVPEHQVLVLLFDDFTSDPAAAYARVLRFLDLADDERADFPVVNENKRLRSSGLARWMRPPAALSRAVASGKRALGLERLHLLGPLRRMNLERRPRDPLPAELRASLTREFEEDIALLARLLDRDLSGWLAPSESPPPGAARMSPAGNEPGRQRDAKLGRGSTE